MGQGGPLILSRWIKGTSNVWGWRSTSRTLLSGRTDTSLSPVDGELTDFNGTYIPSSARAPAPGGTPRFYRGGLARADSLAARLVCVYFMCVGAPEQSRAY